MSVKMHQPENLFDGATYQQTIVGTDLAGMVTSADDLHLIELLRSGNEAAFVSLIDRYHTAMLRLAMVYVTMRNIQVFSEERPSKRSSPSRTANHVSWTTSSATPRIVT